MATLQSRNGSHRLLFQHNGHQHAFTIGKTSRSEALQWKARAESLLMRLKQHLLEIPAGCDVVTFIQHDGKPPLDPDLATRKETTLDQLRKGYIETHSAGAIEKNTLYIAGIHLDHVAKTLSEKFMLTGLTLAKLQEHVNRRQKDVQPVTIKKEIDTFRVVWNWGLRMKWVDRPFPSKGLVYAKTDAKLPFMNFAEIERRIAAGGDPDVLWECLYLTAVEMTEVLEHVRRKVCPPWNYPMLVMAAHTGARKSELLRARTEDVDLANGVVTLREKKRAKGARTTRRVPISSQLAEALHTHMARQGATTYLFGNGDKPLTVQAAHQAVERVFKKTKWASVTWHTLRHSFCSALACAGKDQRLIDEFMGHSTEMQRRRYRHLYPAVSAAAIKSVFG